MKRLAFVLCLLGASLAPARAGAQLVMRNQLGLTMGHVHMIVKDLDAQKRFWIDTMGGTVVKNGTLEMIQYPGVYLVLQQGEPTGPPGGTIVNHFGFTVKDMPGALAKWKAAGVEIETTENPNEVYVHGPESIRVEVYGEPALPTPVSMNHLHYATNAIPDMKAWYTKAFGGNPGRRPCVACLARPSMIESVDLPGVNVSLGGSRAATLPTKGRGIDHISFDVANLESFVAGLASRGIPIEGFNSSRFPARRSSRPS